MKKKLAEVAAAAEREMDGDGEVEEEEEEVNKEPPRASLKRTRSGREVKKPKKGPKTPLPKGGK